MDTKEKEIEAIKKFENKEKIEYFTGEKIEVLNNIHGLEASIDI